jgi:hypothetical protein
MLRSAAGQHVLRPGSGGAWVRAGAQAEECLKRNH